MAKLETKRPRTTCDDDATGDGHGLGSLTGIGAVQHAFHFLDGPADVLRASTASRRWRELACADAVWRPKAVREGMVEKAGVFEVALPAAAAAAGGSGGGDGLDSDHGTRSTSSSSDAIATERKDELSGVGLSFYAQIYVLKVPTAQLVLTIIQLVLTLLLMPLLAPPPLALAAALVRSTGVQDEGRGLRLVPYW